MLIHIAVDGKIIHHGIVDIQTNVWEGQTYTLNSEVFSEHQIGVNLHYFGVNR